MCWKGPKTSISTTFHESTFIVFCSNFSSAVLAGKESTDPNLDFRCSMPLILIATPLPCLLVILAVGNHWKAPECEGERTSKSVDLRTTFRRIEVV